MEAWQSAVRDTPQFGFAVVSSLDGDGRRGCGLRSRDWRGGQDGSRARGGRRDRDGRRSGSDVNAGSEARQSHQAHDIHDILHFFGSGDIGANKYPKDLDAGARVTLFKKRREEGKAKMLRESAVHYIASGCWPAAAANPAASCNGHPLSRNDLGP